MSAADSAAPGPVAPEAKQVLYCPHCTFPPEYCTFSSSASKCKAWLTESHPDLAEKIYGSSSSSAGAADGEGGGESGKKGGASEGDAAAAGATGLEGKLEEGLTLKQKEDEDKEREKKERREEKKKEKEDKERKVSGAASKPTTDSHRCI